LLVGWGKCWGNGWGNGWKMGELLGITSILGCKLEFEGSKMLGRINDG